MFKWWKKQSLSMKVLIGMISGVAVGMIWGPGAVQIKFIGDIFINLLQMSLIPIVLFVMSSAICSAKSPKTLGSIGGKVIAYYMLTTVLAAVIGLVVGKILRPGVGFSFAGISTEGVKLAEFTTFQAFILDLFPKNIIASMSSGNVLHVAVFSIFIGLAAVFMGEKGEPVRKALKTMSDLVQSLVGIIISFSPIGVFCLMAATFGKYGSSLFGPIAKLLGTFYLGTLVHFFLVYILLLWIVTKISPWTFIKKASSLMIYTMSTCSSTASIPMSLKIAKEEFNLSDTVSNFTIPLGSQINKDGNGVLLPIVLIFTAQAAGIPISIPQMFLMVGFAVLVTLGGGGIPGSGIVKIAVLVATFNLPLEIVPIMAGLYRLVDMGITTLNCTGDLAGAIIIDKLEEKKLQKAG